MEKNKKMEIIKEYFFTTLGCILLAFSINYFYIGNKLAEGGITGITLVIHYLTKLDVSYIYLLLNIPLLVVGYKILGKDFILKTLYATLMLTIFLKIFGNLRGPMDDILVASIFGGALNGIAIGIIFVSGGSSGGTDIIAKIINKYKGISISKVLLFIDFIILSSVIFIFGKEIFMYTLISAVVTSKLIDTIQEGINNAKAITIITEHSTEIKQKILYDLERGVTIIPVKGGYTNNDRNLIYCIVGKYQLVRVKEIVERIDPDAFMIVNDVHEVIGSGFTKV